MGRRPVSHLEKRWRNGMNGIAESIIHDGRLYIPDHLLERAGIEKVGLLLAVRENDGIRFVLTNAGGLYASDDRQMSGE